MSTVELFADDGIVLPLDYKMVACLYKFTKNHHNCILAVTPFMVCKLYFSKAFLKVSILLINMFIYKKLKEINQNNNGGYL